MTVTGVDMNQYLGAFIDETSEQLQSLNELLLALESGSGDDGTINEIFRVAHTLKGMSATMGFEQMTHLTHAMEDMLDLVRKGAYTLEEEDISVLFSCLDRLTAGLDLVRGGASDGALDIAPLVKTLHGRVKGGTKDMKEKPQSEAEVQIPFTDQERDWFAEAREQGMGTYQLRVSLDPACALKAARAYMVVSRAGELGDVIKTIPAVEDLEKDPFQKPFVVFLSSHETPEKIRDAVGRISEIRDVTLEAFFPALDGKASPERAKAPGGSSGAAEDLSADASYETKLAPDNGEEPGGEEEPVPGPAVGGKGAKSQAVDAMKRTGRTVRVDIGRLDKLMNLVGELVIGRARIERLAMEARLKAFEEPLSQLGRISGEIQELVTKLRMVPVSFVFDKFPRLVRDLSKGMGKEVRLAIDGKETELDRNVIDEIGDPMVHLIRNSLDHGIEAPGDRVKIGKPKEGTIHIAAYQEGNGVIIEVRDDGKGIDPAKIRAKAVEKGIMTREEAQGLTDEEAIRLTFLPGFSTASVVTDLSGRGVGMDAVKSKVESLNGQFLVESRVGEGTRVLIRLPLTLAIVLALLIRVGEETYAISLENVEETLLVRKEDVKYVHGTPVTNVRGEILSLRDLGTVLGTPVERGDAGEYPVVVVRSGRSRLGFIVDELVGQQEIVIKPLGKLLAKVRGIAGATILGDGNVALILDVASLHSR